MSIFKPFITIFKHPNSRGRLLKTVLTIGWWKFNQLFLHLPAIVEIASGVKIICYPTSSYGSFIVYAKWPEYEELSFIYSYLGLGDTYIDVGAHIGDSSLLAASKVKTGKVIACEPTPQIFDELDANIKLNNFETVISSVPKAISDKVGTAYFTLESASEVNHLNLESSSTSIKIPTITIDELIKEYKLKNISILKIDVEGFELEVIRGAKNALKSEMIEIVLFEVNPSSNSIKEKVREIQAILDRFSFTYYSFGQDSRLKKIPVLFIPTQTSNFIAASVHQQKSKKFQKWLK